MDDWNVHDDRTQGRLLSRRHLIALLGASASGAARSDRSRRTDQSGDSRARLVAHSAADRRAVFVDEALRSDIRFNPATGTVSAGAPLALTWCSRRSPRAARVQCATRAGGHLAL